MESKASIVNNPERIYIVGYKLETKEDFDICIHGLRKTMQMTLDTLALSGHYESVHATYPTKSTDDAMLMNFVLDELKLIKNTMLNNKHYELEVVKKTTRRKKTKQKKISFE